MARRSFIRGSAILLLIVSVFRSVSAMEVLEITPRAGVVLRVLVELPPDATAIAMLFPGGNGTVRIGRDGTIRGTKRNFLSRSRNRFNARGVGTALVDAPSDRQDGEGMTYAYRMSAQHAAEIGLVIAQLRSRYPGRTVWLVGTSRGTLSAVNAATALPAPGPDGLVLTAAISAAGKQGGSVLDFPLGRIVAPVLLVHHAEDSCAVSPPAGANRIQRQLTRAPVAETIMLNGGDSGHGRACDATTHHGFLGIEEKTVDAITAWIGRH